MKRNNNKGFTLAELLIVVAVIAVLVAVAIPTFGSQLEKSRQATDVANLRDAYAIAKLAALNQEDDEWADVFQDSGAMKTEAFAVYCNPDTGELGTGTTAKVSVRKATTATPIESITTGLPSAIKYDATALGANKVYIKVSFAIENSVFKVDQVTFDT